MNKRFNSILRFGLTSVASLVAVHTVSAAVLTDPTLFTEIDPAGSAEVDIAAPGSMTEASLEALSGLSVLQDFTGFTVSSTGPNVVSFTSAALPDIQFTAADSASPNQSGNENSSTTINSSGSSAMDLFNNSGSGRTLTLNVDFGDYDTGLASFDGDVNPVSATGFVLTNLISIDGVTVEFYNPADTIVSTQTVDNSNSDVFFGFDNGSEGISRIFITASFDSGSSTVGFDDLGFVSSIPEPSTYALAFGLFVSCAVFLKRRRR